MRLAFASLIALGVATSALAQSTTDTQPVTPPMATPAPAQPAPMTQPAPAPAADPSMTAPAPAAPTTAAPADPAQPPATTPPPAATAQSDEDAAEAAVQIPPSVVGDRAVKLVNDVCIPLIRGQKIEQVGPAAGMKTMRKVWTLPVDKIHDATVTPPSGANPNFCSLDVPYDPGEEQAMYLHIADWAHTRPMRLARIRGRERSELQAPLITITSAWQGSSDTETWGIAFVEETRTDGKAVMGKATNVAHIVVSITPR